MVCWKCICRCNKRIQIENLLSYLTNAAKIYKINYLNFIKIAYLRYVVTYLDILFAVYVICKLNQLYHTLCHIPIIVLYREIMCGIVVTALSKQIQ